MTPLTPDTPTAAEPRSAETPTTNWRGMAAGAVRAEARRLVVLVAVIAVCMLIIHFSPLHDWIENIQGWKAMVRAHGWAGGLLFSLCGAAGVMVGLPRLALCATAGLIFGFNAGLLWILPGSALGAYGAFLLARFGVGITLARRAAARWPWLQPLLENPTWVHVFWLRQLMLPGLVSNLLLGMSGLRHRHFWGGTLLGYLPLSVVFCLVGSGLGKGHLAETFGQLLTALTLVNLGAWLVWRRFRRPES